MSRLRIKHYFVQIEWSGDTFPFENGGYYKITQADGSTRYFKPDQIDIYLNYVEVKDEEPREGIKIGSCH